MKTECVAESKTLSPYKGYSYPRILQNQFALILWKKFQCPKENHLWDEVWAVDTHYFSCDACGKEVKIKD